MHDSAAAEPNAPFDWPAEGLESVPRCPVCDAEQREALYRGLTDQVFRIAPGEWSLYRCLQCASAWLDPRPTRQTVGLAYSSYYTHSGDDHPIVRRKGLVRRFLHDALNDYRNSRYGLSRRPANVLGRWLIPMLPSLRAAADAQCRHLPPLPPGGRLLDVGFGNGGFLQLAAEIGWHVEGIDFDAKAVAVARERGLNVRCTTAEDLTDVTDRFDVITVCHVIEHVHDPIGLLRQLFRMLKPGGVLWLDTPNLESLGHRRFARHWRDLDPPRHLVLFGVGSLREALASVGFSDVVQRWRGLSVFDVFPVSEAIAESRDSSAASRDGKPPIREVLAELYEMMVPTRREFVTLSAKKPYQR